jgi:NADP-dependent 3-hydroxy acid dehydrogenase YdfG
MSRRRTLLLTGIADITRAADAAAAIKPHADRIDVLIHNPHRLTIKPFEQTTTDEFEQAWRVACLGAVISAQAVVPHMAARRQGTIIFTGATAGTRSVDAAAVGLDP